MRIEENVTQTDHNSFMHARFSVAMDTISADR